MDDEQTLAPTPISYFGGCPTCHGHNGCVNLERTQWFVCHLHRVKWPATEEISRSVFETKEHWAYHGKLLESYDEVKPVHAPERYGCFVPRIRHRGTRCELPYHVQDSLETLLQYVWDNHFSNYLNLPVDGSYSLFPTVATVHAWLLSLRENAGEWWIREEVRARHEKTPTE